MPPLTGSMREALRLVRSGDLRGATALLRGRPAPATPKPADIIDGEFTVVADAAPTHDTAEAAPSSEGEFVSGTFAHRAGTRAYKLWIPAAARAGGVTLPLIVMLHGCTQDADDFATGTRMNAVAGGDSFVLYPIQSASANSHRCWRWFEPGDQQRDRGEAALLADMTRQIAREHPVDARRVYVAGLSAGAAMAVILGATYPDVFAAVGAHSGLPYRVASSVASALSAMAGRAVGLPAARAEAATLGTAMAAIVLHGDSDNTVVSANGEALVEQLVRAHTAAGRGALSVMAERTEGATCLRYRDTSGNTLIEFWTLHGAGHAWSGGDTKGSYTSAGGVDASRRMRQFFAQHALAAGG